MAIRGKELDDRTDQFGRPNRRYSREQVRSLFMDIDRFPEFCERFLVITTTRGGEKIPFRLNPIQRYFFNTYIRPKWGTHVEEKRTVELPGQPVWDGGEPIRVVVLKARQFGFSTMIEAFLFWYVLGDHSRNSLVVASDSSRAMTIFRILRRFYKFLPKESSGLPTFMVSSMREDRIEWGKPHENVRKSYDPKKHPWLVDLDSSVNIKSAGESDDLGRAETFQCVHASECAMWPDFFGSLASLTSCVHPEPRTCMFLETTAKGMNSFYEFWQNEGTEKDGPSCWEKFFAPWYWHKPYEFDGKLTKDKLKFQSEDERIVFERIQQDRTLLEKIDTDVNEERIWRKILWRRWKIKQDLQGNVGMFCQEYPSTPDEAFQFSGASIWPAEVIRKLERDVRKEADRFTLTASFDRRGQVASLERRLGSSLPFYSWMQRHEFGPLTVYEPPKDGEKYAVFFDVAEGKSAANVDESMSKSDYTCGQVIKCTKLPFEQVAVWHGHAPINDVGYIAVALAGLYNSALLGWEVNGVGVALQGPIMDHCQYHNVYMRDDIDSITRQKVLKAGWKTTMRTKPKLVAVSDGFIREGLVILHDQKTINEMRVFSRMETDRSGVVKYEAAKGHDDRVIALMGCLFIIDDQQDYFRRAESAELEKKEEGRKSGGMTYVWEDTRAESQLFIGEED